MRHIEDSSGGNIEALFRNLDREGFLCLECVRQSTKLLDKLGPALGFVQIPIFHGFSLFSVVWIKRANEQSKRLAVGQSA